MLDRNLADNEVGEEYEALKKSIVDRYLAVIERHYPGFGALVVHAELSTPVIPVARGVLIMPLIGTLDDGRALEVR